MSFDVKEGVRSLCTQSLSRQSSNWP